MSNNLLKKDKFNKQHCNDQVGKPFVITFCRRQTLKRSFSIKVKCCSGWLKLLQLHRFDYELFSLVLKQFIPTKVLESEKYLKQSEVAGLLKLGLFLQICQKTFSFPTSWLFILFQYNFGTNCCWLHLYVAGL